jgi:sulfite oxidase
MKLPVHAEGWLELVVRCWGSSPSCPPRAAWLTASRPDNACNTQPTYVRSAWNWDLHVTSSAHRVKGARACQSLSPGLMRCTQSTVPIAPFR